MFLRTVIQGKMASSWKRYPFCHPGPSIGAPAQRTDPWWAKKAGGRCAAASSFHTPPGRGRATNSPVRDFRLKPSRAFVDVARSTYSQRPWPPSGAKPSFAIKRSVSSSAYPGVEQERQQVETQHQQPDGGDPDQHRRDRRYAPESAKEEAQAGHPRIDQLGDHDGHPGEADGDADAGDDVGKAKGRTIFRNASPGPAPSERRRRDTRGGRCALLMRSQGG